SPAPRAVPPGAFTARATHPFNSYPHDPPQSGNAPVLLTHMARWERASFRPHTHETKEGGPLNDGAIVLLLVAAAGLIGGNQLVAVAAAVLLLICATAPAPLLSWIGQYSVQAGILLMTLGLLSPFAAGKIG